LDALQAQLLRVVAAQSGGEVVKQPVDVGEAQIIHAGGTDGPGPVRVGVLLLVVGRVSRIGAGVGKNAGRSAESAVPHVTTCNPVTTAEVVVDLDHVEIGARRID